MVAAFLAQWSLELAVPYSLLLSWALASGQNAENNNKLKVESFPSEPIQVVIHFVIVLRGPRTSTVREDSIL
jgi:hypothetical protein